MSGPGEKVVFALDVCVVMCKRRADKTNTEIWSSGGGGWGQGGGLVARQLGSCLVDYTAVVFVSWLVYH